MDKNEFTRIPLAKGEMNIYDFGTVKLHAYKTNDAMSDEVFIVEKSGTAVVIEPPCFFDNISELAAYLEPFSVAGVIAAYHGAGGSFLSGTPKFSTENAIVYSESGGGKALIDNFAAAFSSAFDSSVHRITHIMGEGTVTIGGIDFVITKTQEAFDIKIPQINAVYTHMMGHDCHSIVAGAAHADDIIAQLKKYAEKGFSLILTSHYTPENLKDVQEKIAYLEHLKETALQCKDADEFKAEVKKAYPLYSGENYLGMTAEMFFG